MVVSTKTLNFMPAIVYEIGKSNHHSNKEKYPLDYRLIDDMVSSAKT